MLGAHSRLRWFEGECFACITADIWGCNSSLERNQVFDLSSKSILKPKITITFGPITKLHSQNHQIFLAIALMHCIAITSHNSNIQKFQLFKNLTLSFDFHN